MRLAFAGTPDFSVAALDALVAAGHEIAAVFTQPPRPAGRGRELQPSPVARRASELGLPVHTPEKFREDAQAILRGLGVEAMVVVAYGLILPAAALAIPARGCFNIHASLLPRWRGAAPIQRAIEAGDAESGVTIMKMDAGLDTGPMLLKAAVTVGDGMTAGELHDALAPLGARLMVEALAQLAAGTARETAQPADGVTYAKKLSKDEARLDWSRPAPELARAVRAFNPVPVAWSELRGAAGPERIRIFRARAVAGRGAAGTVLEAGREGITVAAGDGALRIEQLQRPGGKVIFAAAAAQGWDIGGKRFG